MEDPLTLKDIIPLLCGLMVFIYNFINLYIKGNTKKKRFAEKAKENGWVTEGTCVSTKVTAGDSNATNDRRFTRVKATYEYCVNGKKYYKKLAYSKVTGADHAPYRVTLYYDPDRPKKAYSAGEVSRQNQLQTGCLLTLLYAGCATKLVMELIKHLF